VLWLLLVRKTFNVSEEYKASIFMKAIKKLRMNREGHDQKLDGNSSFKGEEGLNILPKRRQRCSRCRRNRSTSMNKIKLPSVSSVTEWQDCCKCGDVWCNRRMSELFPQESFAGTDLDEDFSSVSTKLLT
jgi:hypothetical protein